jgi:hypothetical protein
MTITISSDIGSGNQFTPAGTFFYRQILNLPADRIRANVATANLQGGVGANGFIANVSGTVSTATSLIIPAGTLIYGFFDMDDSDPNVISGDVFRNNFVVTMFYQQIT